MNAHVVTQLLVLTSWQFALRQAHSDFTPTLISMSDSRLVML
jgi:hypothetical protein